MAERDCDNPLAPGGVLDPNDDLNDIENPDGVPGPTHSTSDSAKFPSNVDTSPHEPESDLIDTGAGGSHDPSGDASFPDGVSMGTHDPDPTGIDPGIEGGTHSPDTDGLDPGIGEGEHSPDPAGLDAGLDGSHDPDVEGIDPGIGEGEHNPNVDGLDPGIDGNHNPNTEGLDPGTTSTDYVPIDEVIAPPCPPARAPGMQLNASDDINRRAHLESINPSYQEIAQIVDGLGEVSFDILGLDEGQFAPGAKGRFVGQAGSMGLDPSLYSKQLINIGNALGQQGIAAFGIQQAFLYSLNNDGQQIWDPAYFVNRAPILNSLRPVAQSPSKFQGLIGGEGLHESIVNESINTVSTTSTAVTKNPRFNNRITKDYNPPFVRVENNIGFSGEAYKQNTRSGRSTGAPSQDDSLLTRTMATSEQNIPLVDLAMKVRNMYTPDRTYEEYAVFTTDELIEEEANNKPNLLVRRKDQSNAFTLDTTKLFEKQDVKLGTIPTQSKRSDNRDQKNVSKGLLAAAAFPNGIIPMGFTGEKEGAFVTGDSGPPKEIDDDTAYVPLVLTDARPIVGEGTFRHVYFRPIIKALTENFAPQWNKTNYYGRVDPVAIWQATNRSIFLTFELHAFSFSDLEVMFNKLHWLTSMVYPELSDDLTLKSAPVCRLRVGDVIRNGIGGLPGIIESLDLDYSESIWELRKDSKVPRSIIVNMSFTVLHETIIGRGRNGRFGGIGFVNSEGQYTTVRNTTDSTSDSAIISADRRTFGEASDVYDGTRSFRSFGAPKGDEE